MKMLQYDVPGHKLARAVEAMGRDVRGFDDTKHDELMGMLMENPDKHFGVQIGFTQEELERLLADPHLEPGLRSELEGLLAVVEEA